EMIEHAIEATVNDYAPEGSRPDEWDLAALRQRLVIDYFLVVEELPQREGAEHDIDDRERLIEIVLTSARAAFKRKLESFGEMRDRILSFVMLSVIDQKWRDHLYDLDHLKASIGFRGWGQKDPLIEYKQEAYTMFVDLMRDIRKQAASLTYRATLEVPRQQRRPMPPLQQLTLSGPSDVQPTSPAHPPEAEQVEQPTDAIAAAMSGARRTAAPRPVGAAAAAPAITGVGRVAQPTDVSRLQTNRGADGGAAKPAPATAET